MKMDKNLYKVGATTALLLVLVSLVDFTTGFSGGAQAPGSLTAVDWFALFHEDWFLGLGNLGLFNMIYYLLTIPTFLALMQAHREASPTGALLATVFWLIGIAIYISTNTALPMWALSAQYAAAGTEAQRSLLTATAQAVLARGEDLTPATFFGFLIPELASIGMAVVMLRGKIFSRVIALIGMLAQGLLLVFNVLVAFVPAMFNTAMMIAAVGGLSVMAWYILVARRLYQLR